MKNVIYLKKIARHVDILNNEVGKLQIEVRWIKRILYYLASIFSLALGKIIFFS